MIISKKLKQNIEIINYYVDNYGCIPRVGKFVEDGGDLDYICNVFNSYDNFIKELGFDDYGYRRLKKYGVHDIRREKIIYVGFLRDIAEVVLDNRYELETLKKVIYANKLIDGRYLIRKDISNDRK